MPLATDGGLTRPVHGLHYDVGNSGTEVSAVRFLGKACSRFWELSIRGVKSLERVHVCFLHFSLVRVGFKKRWAEDWSSQESPKALKCRRAGVGGMVLMRKRRRRDLLALRYN